jgi:DNA-binding NtrC family response regulator
LEKLIFIVDDEESILKMLTHWCKTQWNYSVKTFINGNDVLNSLSENPDIVLLDIMLPDINGNDILRAIKLKNPQLPVIMLSAQGSVEVALESVKLGAYDYFPKPIDKNRLEPAIRNAIKNYELEKELASLNEIIQQKYSFDNIISADDKMQNSFRMVSKVLDNDITVLITGESGTGKELVARAIHYNGKRKSAPFVVVNCASIPRELLESELFGHEKGSFTGAHQRKIGKFELARGGTIFLDEIGEMEMSLQAKILRVIQQKEFERIGGNEVIKSDVRIISATNRDLKLAVESKHFREDLYYRLSSFPIHIPPLRERKRDIVVLIDHFLKQFNTKLSKSIKNISKPALKILYDYDWPGNVRELENTLERCIILSEGESVDVDVLPTNIISQVKSGGAVAGVQLFDDNSPVVPFERLKEEAIKHALKVTDNNIVEAARKLKIGRATLYRLMDKYKINNEKK